MKKRLFAILLVAITVVSLCACGKFTCDLCGKEKSGKNYKTDFLGTEITICEDCHKAINELEDEFGDELSNIGEGLEKLGEDLKDELKDGLGDLGDGLKNLFD